MRNPYNRIQLGSCLLIAFFSQLICNCLSGKAVMVCAGLFLDLWLSIPVYANWISSILWIESSLHSCLGGKAWPHDELDFLNKQEVSLRSYVDVTHHCSFSLVMHWRHDVRKAISLSANEVYSLNDWLGGEEDSWSVVNMSSFVTDGICKVEAQKGNLVVVFSPSSLFSSPSVQNTQPLLLMLLPQILIHCLPCTIKFSDNKNSYVWMTGLYNCLFFVLTDQRSCKSF